MVAAARLLDSSRRGLALVRLLGLVVAAALVLLLASAAPAAAHARLVASDPVDGATLGVAPTEVALTFNQEVAIAPGAVSIDHGGVSVDIEPARHPSGRGEVVVAALPALENGRYVVSWRVTSADGDPITGTLVFDVAAAGAAADSPGANTAAGGRAPTPPPVPSAGSDVSLPLGILRFAGFTAMVLVVGAGLHAFVLAPSRSVRGRTKTLLLWSALVVALTGLLGIGVGAAHAGGRGLAAATDPDLIRSFLGTTAARAMLARAVVAAVMVVVLLDRRVPSPARRWLALLTGNALVLTFVASGHAITGEHVPLAVVADFVHLAAAGAWLGGLASLLMLGGARDPGVTRRFSTTAAWAVVALVVSGAFAVWRQAGQISGLVDSEYGRLLLTKLLLVSALLVLGAVSRRAVRRALASRLERSVAAEAGIALVVLAVTAALVGTAPHADATPPDHAQREWVADGE